MIAYLSGTVLEKDLESIVLNVNGVGYLVAVTNNIIEKIQVGDELSIYTYLSVRENALDLYGFGDKSEQEMFELLLTISGVGPKSAMGIMSSSDVSTLTEGISSGDASYLSKMSGIGKKTAEKIIVNLKEKIGDLSFASGSENTSQTSGSQSNNAMAIDALVALGYSERESREAIQGAVKNLSDSNKEGSDPADAGADADVGAEIIIKEALKNLGGGNNKK
jgi:Holliday junction DNA helicase RuvA